MAIVFEKTKMLTDAPMHYCPGCTHGIAHRLVAECIEELHMEKEAIGVAPVGARFLHTTILTAICWKQLTAAHRLWRRV